ncbi:MAG: ABC-F family ATP-binding cassette domain-containing protein [Bacteroidetes bacterium]|nr:ABC-F family ATP-binding cassette domain-containing protein [Bacteroidota bacterium]
MHIHSTHTVYEETMTAFEELQLLSKEIEKLNEELSGREDYESTEYQKLFTRLSEKHDRSSVLGAGANEGNVEKVLKGLGFKQDDLTRKVSELSGGWQMRVELAKLLLRMPDLLLLDEPTNHLDIDSIIWLEEFFDNYPGAIIMISHDIMFLDNITKRTVEMVFGRIYDYMVPYSKFFKLREERLESQQNAFKNQQKLIATTERLIERFRAKNTKASFAQSLIKKLEKMDKVELENLDKQKIKFRFSPAPRSGAVALKGKHFSKSYGDKLVLKDLTLSLDRGDRVAFVGRNGEGKTTLVKAINKEIDFEGVLELGHNVEIGYYAQVQGKSLAENITVVETIEQEATGEWASLSKIMGLLGAFLFTGNDFDKKVKVLSGGEKSRLALAKLLLKPANLLILDEPTNHLDVSAKEVLKQALQQYDGTLILVSHDREFLQGLTNRTFEFKNHSIKEHLGDINDFLSKHKVGSFRDFEKSNLKKEEKQQKQISSNKQQYHDKKERDRRFRKLTNLVNKTEKRIHDLEEEIQTLESLMQGYDFYDDKEKADKAVAQYEAIKFEHEEQMKVWEEAHEKLEAMSNNDQ